jgi:hypothetical protein
VTPFPFQDASCNKDKEATDFAFKWKVSNSNNDPSMVTNSQYSTVWCQSVGNVVLLHYY